MTNIKNKDIPQSLIKKVIKYKYKDKVIFKEITYIKAVRDFFEFLKKEIIKASLKESNLSAVLRNIIHPYCKKYKCPMKANRFLIHYVSSYIKKRLDYMNELPNLEVVNIDIPWILDLKPGEKFYGDCDDTAFLICTIFIIINRWYELDMKISLTFTSHMKGKNLHHAYTEIAFNTGKTFIIALVRKENKKLPIFAKISYTFKE